MLSVEEYTDFFFNIHFSKSVFYFNKSYLQNYEKKKSIAVCFREECEILSIIIYRWVLALNSVFISLNFKSYVGFSLL